MRKRVLAAILGVSILAVILFGLPLMVVVGRMLDESATLRLERQAILASRSVPSDFATSNDPVEFPAGSDGAEFGLYDRNGVLVSGHGPDAADEVTRQALANDVADLEVGEFRVVAVAVAFDEVVIGAVRVEQSTVAGDARATRIYGLVVGLAVVVVLVGAGVGWVVAGRLAGPVLRLRDAAVQLGEGDFAVNVPDSAVAEVDEAGRALSVTARRLDDLMTRERMFSADVSHQLRTPIAGLRAAVETELAFPRSDANDLLREAVADLDRLEQTVTELLAVARRSGSAVVTLSLDEVFHDVQTKWSRAFEASGRVLKVLSARFAPPVVGSAANLRHALDVLIDNALRHGAGRVEVSFVVNEDSITVRVSDEGPGFASGTDRIARQGNDEDGSTHGLGLPLARRLVEAMPGRLTITRSEAHPRIDIVVGRALPAKEAVEPTH